MTYSPQFPGYNCSGCNTGYITEQGNPGYSSIDSVISSYTGPPASCMEAAVQQYEPVLQFKENSGNSYGISESISSAAYTGQAQGYSSRHELRNSIADTFTPNLFLNRDRPASPFIGSSEEVKHYIKDAFEKTTGKAFPDNILIRVVDTHELRQLHEEFGGQWNPGIQGFSINKKGFGQSIIVCRENDLDRLLVTIGHEIGHVIEFPLSGKLDEEAKAFAFEMAWLKALHEHNIGGLKRSINPDPEPARNGLHDVAFRFVKKQLLLGRDCFELIKDLMSNIIRVEGENDVLQ